jgi:hypothetical protein
MRNDPFDVFVTTSDGDSYKAFTWIYGNPDGTGARGAIARAKRDAKRFGVTLTSVTVCYRGAVVNWWKEGEAA